MVVEDELSFFQWRIFFFVPVGVTVAGGCVEVFSSDGGVFRCCFEGEEKLCLFWRIFVRKNACVE